MKITASYPLSPTQTGMLFNYLLRPEAGIDIEQVIITLPEEIDPSTMADAWRRLATRHDALRTSFHWDGLPEPEQRIVSEVNLSFEFQDLEQIIEERQREMIERYLEEDRRTGFDLKKAPLLRIALFRFNRKSYQLIWTVHHILLDGRSFVPLLEEVFRDYRTLREGNETEFKTRRPYRDFIDWLGNLDMEAARLFWKEKLAAFSEPTPLPLDQSEFQDAGSEPDFSRQTLIVSREIIHAIRKLAERNDLTLNTFLQGAWAILLGRYSHRQDVLFGVTRAGRKSTVEGSLDIVGNFINTLPLRVRLDPDSSVLDLLKQIRQLSLETRPYEHTPATSIKEWSAIPSSRPLFESLLFFENQSLQTRLRALGGQWNERTVELREQTNFPITIAAYAEDVLELNLIYDNARFGHDDMQRVLNHLGNLLERMTHDLALSPARIPIMSKTETDRMVFGWNKRTVDYPRHRCVHELFEDWAERAPERAAVVFEGERINYGELNRRANRVAWRLRGLGVKPDQLVGIRLDRSLAQVVAVLGVLKAGAGYVPLDPQNPSSRLSFILNDSGARILICSEENEPLPVLHRVVLEEFEERAGAGGGREENPPVVNSASDLAYVIYTSGSTGNPKGVMIEHRNVVGFLHAIGSLTRLSGPRIGTSVSSFSFDVSIDELFSCLCFGGTVHLIPPWCSTNGKLFVQYMAENGINTTYIMPFYVQDVAEELSRQGGFPSLKCLMTGIAPVKQRVLQRIRDTFPRIRIMNCYGPTEVTWGPCGYVFHQAIHPNRIAPIGKPFPNYRMYVLDDNLQPVPPGVTGELFVGGAGVARGYLNQPETTAESFIPDPFLDDPGERVYRTGDMVRFQADGNVVFVGRRDNQVKIRGYRIELGEIETVLVQHPAIARAVVICREDHGSEKQLAAYLVFERGASVEQAEIRAFIRKRLPLYMVPAAIIPLDKIPVTVNGKLDVEALPVQTQERTARTSQETRSRSTLEAWLTKIWKDVLDVDEVGCNDNFFDLGGDSLSLIQMRSIIETELGLKMNMALLFKAPTIAQLTAVLGETLQT